MRHPVNRKRRSRALVTFAAWQLWKRTVRRPLTVTYWHGLRIRAYPDSKSAALAVYTGLPEYDDMIFTERLLRPKDTVVDVGANIGLYTLLAASRVKDGRVVALEPHPVASRRLNENVELNGMRNVDVRAEAAGSEPGSALLTANLDTTNYIVLGRGPHDSISVPLVTLDDLIPVGGSVALVKLDAEGFESAVLAGAGRLLREGSVMAWIVEVNGLGGRYEAGGETIVERFRRFGYLPYRYFADENRLAEGDAPTGKVEWNVIFIKNLELVRERLNGAAD